MRKDDWRCIEGTLETVPRELDCRCIEAEEEKSFPVPPLLEEERLSELISEVEA